MADVAAQLQETLRDRYLLERELRRGGMASIYLARETQHGQQVAIKVLHPDLATALDRQRFIREMGIAASLAHPLIVPLYDSGSAAGVSYYVMPYVEGESLYERLQRDRLLALEDALQITNDLASALGYAHSRGVLHRDVKPENILLAGGRALVADFGLARAIGAADYAKLTDTGLTVGTVYYMSPEQIRADRDLDQRADVYSLGCVLYEMLTGELPYTGVTPHQVVCRIARAPVPSVRRLQATVPPAIDHAISRALAKSAAERFATMQEFAAALPPQNTGSPLDAAERESWPDAPVPTGQSGSQTAEGQIARYVRVRHARVAYRDEGNGSPVLLLHGCPFSSFVWRKVIPLVARDHRCVAPDLLGLGDTETPADADWSLRAQAAMVIGLLDELDIARAHMVGHDHGGAVAQVLAAEHPERVARLVLSNAEAYDNWPSAEERAFVRLTQIPLLGDLALRLWASRPVLRYTLSRAHAVYDPNVLTAELLDGYIRANFADRHRRAKTRRFLALQFQPSNNRVTLDLLDGLRRFDHPTLLLWGQDDPHFGPEWGERLRRDIPGAVRMELLPQTGHLLMEERPEQFAAVVTDFLA